MLGAIVWRWLFGQKKFIPRAADWPLFCLPFSNREKEQEKAIKCSVLFHPPLFHFFDSFISSLPTFQIALHASRSRGAAADLGQAMQKMVAQFQNVVSQRQAQAQRMTDEVHLQL